ncbi:MAG: hypothetical protein PSV22_14315 [Pseudolabrys sp.]|nr:hypothetical protein [Pseudolabrys sp.]
MALIVRDITIDQGATFQKHYRWKDASGTYYNLTGWTARMQVRDKFTSVGFLIELTTENGRIALSSSGDIQLTIAATDTNGLTAPKSGVYDLELVSPSGVVTRFSEGTCRITPGVTHA